MISHVHTRWKELACSFLVILTGLSSALAECPPASCRCRDRELATCINTDDANCSVLCLQGNYTAKEPLAVTRDLSVIADGSATVTCNGGGAFLAVSDTDYVELRNVVVKNCFQAVKFENVTRVRIIGTTFRLVVI